MVRSYFKLALRNLLKRRGYSMLNILGLAIGISCCLLIFQYVSYEKSFDSFLPKASRIFRLRLDHYQQGRLDWQSAAVYPAFGPTMKKDFPEIEDYCRLASAQLSLSTQGGNVKFTETNGYYADASFISIFNLKVKEGDVATALTGMDKIMLSEQMARKYFHDQDPIGQVLIFHSSYSTRPFRVTGVFEALPSNSHLAAEFLVSYPTVGFFHRRLGDKANSEETSWGWYQFYTYLLLKPGASSQELESKFPAFCDRYINSQETAKANNIRSEVHLLPVSEIHLHSHYMLEARANGDARIVSFLFIVAFFVICIAWVNYINLSTARSVERAKEVGVRKLLGAERRSLIFQFFAESTIINLVSFLVALIITVSTMPWFRTLAGNNNLVALHLSGSYWALLICIFIAGSFLSGLYPALVLSGFKPVSVLKGAFKNSGIGITLRKSLIIFQFATSVVLIAGTMTVYRQLNFMRSQPLGANINQTLIISGPSSMPYTTYQNTYEPFKNSIQQLPGVRSMTVSSSVMGVENSWANDVWRMAPNHPGPVNLHFLGVDHDFLPSYDIRLAAGRNFSPEISSDSSGAIINEAASQALGFENPQAAIGQKLIRGDTMTILGVIRNYHTESLVKAIDPLLIRLMPSIRSVYSVKVRPGNISQILGTIKTTWNNYFPNDPFDYYFLDDSFDAQYKADQQFGNVFGFFALLAIIIACIGLMGLSAYSVLQRRKEIGIRKVLGATVSSVFASLSKSFIRLVVVAIVFAWPLVWILMSKWLQNYAYRINMSWWTLTTAGLLAIGMALITVSFQIIKAALENPVTSLRSE